MNELTTSPRVVIYIATPKEAMDPHMPPSVRIRTFEGPCACCKRPLVAVRKALMAVLNYVAAMDGRAVIVCQECYDKARALTKGEQSCDTVILRDPEIDQEMTAYNASKN